MKNYFKNIFSKDCSWIEYLSFGISLFMLIVSIAYLIINPGELKIEDYSRTFAFISGKEFACFVSRLLSYPAATGASTPPLPLLWIITPE